MHQVGKRVGLEFLQMSKVSQIHNFIVYWWACPFLSVLKRSCNVFLFIFSAFQWIIYFVHKQSQIFSHEDTTDMPEMLHLNFSVFFFHSMSSLWNTFAKPVIQLLNIVWPLLTSVGQPLKCNNIRTCKWGQYSLFKTDFKTCFLNVLF